jgi:osmoprotectant transport system ATP-binding protein
MQDGKLIQFDTPEQILRHPVNEFVRTFFGADRMNQVESLPTIEEVMIRPISSFPKRGLAESLIKMRKYKIDSLLVIDKSETFLGVAGVGEIQKNFSNENMVLEDVMKKEVPTVRLSQQLDDAINLISENQVAFLPVLDESRKLKGLITRASLVDVMANQLRSNNNGVASVGGDDHDVQ